MNPTAAIFFLILGQAGDGYTAPAGGLTTIPAHYETLASCEAAGEAARANNLGLSYLSYTCVPASTNVEKVFNTASRSELPMLQKAAASGTGRAKCDEVCELIEAMP